MGAIWLDGRSSSWPPLPDVLRAAGLEVATWEGWQWRSRSSGGFEELLGVVVHHTASPATTSFQNDWSYCAVGHADAPVANALLGRQGQWGVHAAGASNHAGKGGPWTTSRGTIPTDSANSRCIGIEASNNGTGEPWSAAMLESYELGVAAMVAAYGLTPPDAIAHREWAPGRKIDPFGGTPPTAGFPYTGNQQWPMRGGPGTFTAAVAARLTAGPGPDPDQEEDMIYQLIEPAVAGITAPAWFVVYGSGRVRWASNADSLWCSRNGVAPERVEMGADQYQRLLNDATGWPLELVPAGEDPEPARAP
jgi:hypothetical protein